MVDEKQIIDQKAPLACLCDQVVPELDRDVGPSRQNPKLTARKAEYEGVGVIPNPLAAFDREKHLKGMLALADSATHAPHDCSGELIEAVSKPTSARLAA